MLISNIIFKHLIFFYSKNAPTASFEKSFYLLDSFHEVILGGFQYGYYRYCSDRHPREYYHRYCSFSVDAMTRTKLIKNDRVKLIRFVSRKFIAKHLWCGNYLRGEINYAKI